MDKIIIKAGELRLAELRAIFTKHIPIELDSSAYENMAKSEALVTDVIDSGKTVYGINTGFGELAKISISSDKLSELQRNLVLSHATGVGNFLSDAIVRLILVLKINALAQGHSGVRRDIVDFLLYLYNSEIYPCIPEKGSVGASGDLPPLAHMALPMLGVGRVRVNGEVHLVKDVQQKFGIKNIELAPKEGLALLNGTQVTTALALRGLFMAEENFAGATVAGALAIDAVRGSDAPFNRKIHEVRRQKGQIAIADIYRDLLKNSEIRKSHKDGCDKVQDPYSLRCQPQVMGACLDQIRHSAGILEREANAVTDNPLIFSDSEEVFSGGNFHAEPVGFAADGLAIAVAEIGAMSERRIAMLIDSKISGLPPFLVQDAGMNSGFMIAHVTAAALASENKSLSFPSVVDSLPTSANQEDHVSMATYGARRLIDMVKNTANIVGIELIAAVQGVEFHAPLKTSPKLQKVMKLVRKQVDPYNKDHYFAPDIRRAANLVRRSDIFVKMMPSGLLPSCG